MSEDRWPIPLSEIEYLAMQEGRITGTKLVLAMNDAVVFATDQAGLQKRIDPRILAYHGGGFVFIDQDDWTIIDPKEAPPMIGVAEAIRGDMNLYAGGFTAVDAEYDERLGEVLRLSTEDRFESAWRDAIDQEKQSQALTATNAKLARSFAAYAGMKISAHWGDQHGDLVTLIEQLPFENSQLEAFEFVRVKTSSAIAEREWKAWVATFVEPDKPNKLQRRAWGKARGITRDRVEDLQRRLSPEYWSKVGRTRSTS